MIYEICFMNIIVNRSCNIKRNNQKKKPALHLYLQASRQTVCNLVVNNQNDNEAVYFAQIL